MGINTLSTPSAIQQSFVYTNNGVSKNDLIVYSETGYCNKVPNTLLISQSNNNTAGTSLLSSNQTYANYNYNGDSSYSSRWGKTSCQLGNGLIALVYPGDGSSNAYTGVNIQIRGYGNNSQTITPIYVYDTGVNFVKITPLNSSLFAICWSNGSGNINFDIYTNAGVSLLGATYVASSYVSNQYDDQGAYYNLMALPNGDLVIAYTKSDATTAFQRYNSSGVLQGSEVTVQSSAYGKYIQILPLSSGNFVVTYLNSASYQYRFSIFSSSNAVVKSNTLIKSSSSGSSIDYGYYDASAVQLTNGNIVFVTSTNATNTLVANVYDSSGNVINQNIFETSSTYAITKTRPGLCATGYGFAILSIGSSANYLYTFDFTGIIQSSRTQLASRPAGANGGTYYTTVGCVLFDNGGAGLAHSTSLYDGSFCSSYVQSFSLDGTIIGTAITNIASGSGYGNLNYQNVFYTSDGNMYKNYRYDYGWNCSAYFTCRKSIYGVSQETSSANTIFKVATAGAYNLTASYTGGTFNTRTNTVSGTKGSVIGSVASLQGLV